MSRLFAVGDIHGCCETMISLVDSLDLRSGDRVVFVGDYIDRGPDSRGVVSYLLEWKKRAPDQLVLIRGNHEQMLLDAIRDNDNYDSLELWLYNGGVQTLWSYGAVSVYDIPTEHIEFFNNTQAIRFEDDYIFVHAGLLPVEDITDMDPSAMLWVRNEFIESDHDWGCRVVFGHTPQKEPLIQDNKIGIDTGCVYPQHGHGVLTCIELPSMKIHQQRNIDMEK